MKRKKQNKKPPTGQGQGGKGENERGRDVFYPDNNTNPTNCQIDMPKVDYAKLADVLELHAEVYRLRADEARLLMIIQAGGTIYPI